MNKLFTVVILIVFSGTVILAQANKTSIKKTVGKSAAQGTVNYDFTTGADKFYGGSSGAVEVEAGVWGMIAGDANGDGGVFAEDYTAYQVNQGTVGYLLSDFNLDGGVFAEDYTIYQVNQGKVTQVP